MVFIRLIIILNWHGGIVFRFAKQIYNQEELPGLKGDNSKSFLVHWILNTVARYATLTRPSYLKINRLES